ncbi:YopX family protein [Streptococcus hillyeri]|uniref:YopX family protein n=1 Tax=Streptococcus hillyeri TaxID=2282420 RepID=UPI0034E26414
MIPKIRTWDTEMKKMYSWEDIIINKEKGDDYLLLGYKEGVITHFDHKQIPMMSTYLFDNSNPPKEIFEGDVVAYFDSDEQISENVIIRYGKHTDEASVFEEKPKHIGFYIEATKGTATFDVIGMYEDFKEDIKVIGNIYENPELLEG